MKKTLLTILLSLLLGASAGAQSSDEMSIRTLTLEFCRAIVAGDLSALDKVFDQDPSNVYYDINEQMVGFARMRQVWQAATTNYKITRFDFGSDMKIAVTGDHAVQTGTWQQTQVPQGGSARSISGRATILWKKTPSGWRAYHYHGSITPNRR